MLSMSLFEDRSVFDKSSIVGDDQFYYGSASIYIQYHHTQYNFINCRMLFRLTRNTCWYRQNLFANTRFHFGSQKNEKNDETQSVSKNNPIIKEDGKNQTGNVESHKGNNLHKLNQERQHPNGTESNMVPISVLSQILKHQQKLSEQQLEEQREARKSQEKLLEEQREARKSQEKLSEQQLQQQREARKSQEKLQKAKNFRDNLFYIASVILGGYGLYYIWKKYYPQSQQYKQNQREKIYGVVNPVMTDIDTWLIQTNFPNNQTRKHLTEIMFSKMTGNAPLRIITGVPGNGKTTEIKQLVKKLRKQGHIVYYHNLRGNEGVREIQTKQDKIKLVLELFNLLSLFYSQKSRPSQGKLVYLVIDDINMLESSENTPDLAQEIKLFWVRLAAVSQKQTHRAIVISSSSSYVSALKSKSYVQKESVFIHLKMKTPREMKQAIKKIFDFHFREKNTDSKQYEKTIQYIVKQRYTLRQVMQNVPFVLELFKKGVPDEGVPDEGVPEEGVPDEGVPDEGVPDEGVPDKGVPEEGVPDEGVPDKGVPEEGVPDEGVPDDQRFLKKFKTEQKKNIQQESSKARDSVLKMYKDLGSQSQKQYHKKVLQEILNLKQYNQTGCLKISERLESIKQDNTYFSGKNTLNEVLEGQNLVFYCYPRTEKSRRILQIIFANMK